MGNHFSTRIAKKSRLGPQNSPRSLEPENHRKITRKLQQWTIVLSQWNRWVATDIHLDQSSLLRKQWSPLRRILYHISNCVLSWSPGMTFVEVKRIPFFDIPRRLRLDYFPHRPCCAFQGRLIHLDIGGHPPIPLALNNFPLWQFPSYFSAIFRVLNFWGHFEALTTFFGD